MNKPSSCGHSGIHLLPLLRGRAQAEARITGSESYPAISGLVRFFQTGCGVIVCAEICGLPQDSRACHERIFGFHIHEGTSCGSGMDGAFAGAMSHYNPNDCGHPHHAGDLPPLFGNNGLALSAFLTNRFSVDEVTGRTVIIHDQPDDFTTQPSGNSGTKIACGVIRSTRASCR
ncbi:MAG: superoxide dismutase family protein [Oscillospiraceae bacterium]|nr:superoxide dismutase family protein [Oscillospiraceae bacterium]